MITLYRTDLLTDVLYRINSATRRIHPANARIYRNVCARVFVSRTHARKYIHLVECTIDRCERLEINNYYISRAHHHHHRRPYASECDGVLLN